VEVVAIAFFTEDEAAAKAAGLGVQRKGRRRAAKAMSRGGLSECIRQKRTQDPKPVAQGMNHHQELSAFTVLIKC